MVKLKSSRNTIFNSINLKEKTMAEQTYFAEE